MPVFEVGSTAATLQGVLLFGALSAFGWLVGLGALALMGVVREPDRQAWLAPFVATVIWALTAGLLIRAGLTMAVIAPGVIVVSVLLAAMGARHAVREMRGALTTVRAVAGCWLGVLVVAWPYVRRGLAATIGSPNTDTVLYTAMAAVFWRHGTEVDEVPHTLFFERMWAYFSDLALARNHTYTLLSLFSPLVEAGEPLLVRNVFVCWALLVLACSAGFCAASWRLDPARDARPWQAPVCAAVTLGLGWAAVPMLVGNWDNGLFVAVGPALAGLLVHAPRPGLAYAALVGSFAAYGVYTYPELAPVLVLIMLPLVAAHLCDRGSRRAVLTSLGMAAAIATAILALGARPIVVFFLRQMAGAAGTPGELRPGGAFAQGLLLARWDPSAWWALGAEHSARLGLSGASIAGAGLTLIAMAGYVRLVRRHAMGEATAIIVLVVMAAYFVVVDEYGYGAYKVLSVGWWLIATCLVEGVTGMRGWRPLVASIKRERGLAVLAGGGAIALVAIAVVLSTVSRWTVYASDAIAREQPSVSSLMGLRAAAARQPWRDVLLSGSATDPSSALWLVYAVRDSPLWIFHSLEVPMPPIGVRPWRHSDLPESSLLRVGDARGAHRFFRLPELELVESRTLVLLDRIDSPNRDEAWGTWLGTTPIAVTVRGAPGLRAMMRFEAEPGPSLPETPERTLVLKEGGVTLGARRISRPTMVAFTFVATGEEQVLELSTPDRPTVARMPNGDDRALLVSIKNLAVAPAQ